jgi:exosome complex RNA-binding protein Csl4
MEKTEKKSDRKVVVPGETIVTGEDYLPGENTRREGKDIVAGN